MFHQTTIYIAKFILWRNQILNVEKFQNNSIVFQILTIGKPNLNTFLKPFWKYGGRGGVEPTPTLVPLTCWVNHPMAIFPSWVLNLKLNTHLECLGYVPKNWDFCIMVPSREVVCSSKSQWSEESEYCRQWQSFFFSVLGRSGKSLFLFLFFFIFGYCRRTTKVFFFFWLSRQGEECPLLGTISFHFIFMMQLNPWWSINPLTQIWL